MKRFICAALFSICLLPLGAEVRTRVNTEIYNTIISLSGLDGEWSYMLSGRAGVSFKSMGAVRGEIALDFTETGFTTSASAKGSLSPPPAERNPPDRTIPARSRPCRSRQSPIPPNP